HKQSISKAYDILGISRSASDAEVKKAYRRLMSQHHPDKLIAKGLPEEMIKFATEKTQEIKAAYEQVKDSRHKT
ncbi:MAG: DnaJ domain-containing protein, partial [Gammaproteobacteria bacterium]